MSTVEMTLARTLKYKNDLVQLMNETKILIIIHNSYDSRNTPKFDINEKFTKLKSLVDHLAAVKAAIAVANAPIQALLHKQAELRSFCSTLDSIPTDDKVYSEYVGHGTPHIERTMLVFLSEKDILENKAHIQTEIRDLQDKIDTFNATTKVSIPILNNL